MYWYIIVNCSNLYYSATSPSVVIYMQALLTPALQTDRQIELDGHSIRFALRNRFESILLPIISSSSGKPKSLILARKGSTGN